MLILRREVEESVILLVGDERIRLKIIEIDGRKGRGVRIGFQASKQVSIWREEVLERIEMERRSGRTIAGNSETL